MPTEPALSTPPGDSLPLRSVDRTSKQHDEPSPSAGASHDHEANLPHLNALRHDLPRVLGNLAGTLGEKLGCGGPVVSSDSLNETGDHFAHRLLGSRPRGSGNQIHGARRALARPGHVDLRVRRAGPDAIGRR